MNGGKGSIQGQVVRAIKALSGLRGGPEFGTCEKRRKGGGGGWGGGGVQERPGMLSEAELDQVP